MTNINTDKDNLADMLYAETEKPIDTGLEPANTARYDEVLIVLNYMLDEYCNASERGEPDSFKLPAEFTPQDDMKRLFELATKEAYLWSTHTEEMSHKKCGKLYLSLKKISDSYETTLTIKAKTIDTLIHEGIHNKCAEAGGKFRRHVNSKDHYRGH